MTEIVVDYYFEQQQNFRIDVYDVDDANNLLNLQKQEFIGSIEFKLAKLVSSRNQELEAGLENSARKKSSGKIKVCANEKKEGFGKTQTSFVPKAEIPSCSGACFITMARQSNNNKYKIVYKTEGKQKVDGCVLWNQIIIDTDTLCENNNSQPVLVQIF